MNQTDQLQHLDIGSFCESQMIAKITAFLAEASPGQSQPHIPCQCGTYVSINKVPQTVVHTIVYTQPSNPTHTTPRHNFERML